METRLTLRVPDELDGERVDKVLAVLLGVSRSAARQLVGWGVEVDGRPAAPDQRVEAGASVSTPEPETTGGLSPEEVEFGVVYEDADVVVVDKPPGLVVHPGSGATGPTLAAGLLHRYPELEGVGTPGRWGLVHRLDKNTSGLLLVARTAAAHRALTTEMSGRKIHRRYLTLVDGVMDIPTGTIEAPIGRDPQQPTRRAVTHDGRRAVTHYEVLEVFPQSPASLLQVTLETGRTHQIRVHLAAIGHPVLGDPVYGHGPTAARSPRVFLHAAVLEFGHPRSGERITVRSDLPPDLDDVLTALRSGSGE